MNIRRFGGLSGHFLNITEHRSQSGRTAEFLNIINIRGFGGLSDNRGADDNQDVARVEVGVRAFQKLKALLPTSKRAKPRNAARHAAQSSVPV